jgi:lipoprotein signal peptidase
LVLFLATFAGLILADQLAKVLVTRMPAKTGKRSEADPRMGFRPHLTLKTNPQGGQRAVSARAAIGVWLLAGAAVAFMLVISEWSPALTAGLALALGGAGSNLLDRLRHGAVVDYLALPSGFTFNLADAGIFAGSAIAIAGFLVG